jgi:putative ABC transport system permease protein
MVSLWPLILRNSWRNRRRTVLTVLSIGASMCLLGLLLAIYHAFFLNQPTPEQAVRLVTRNRVSLVFPMPESYADKIRRVPGVREVVIRDWFGGTYKDNRDTRNIFPRFAVEPDRLFAVYGDISLPEDQKQAFRQERTACIVGRDLARRLGLQLGDHITIKGDIYPMDAELTVRGIFDSPLAGEVLFFNRKYTQESLPPARRGQANMFSIRAESPEAVPRIAQAVDGMFRNSPVETKTESEQAFALSFVNSLGNVKMFLLSICGALTFTILLVAGNTMAMSVRERVREVGVLKTLGFPPEKILGIILGEALILSLAGGLLGYGLSSLLCLGMRNAPVFFTQVKHMSIPPPVAILCLAAAAVIGMVSACIPAWNAARVPILEALRSAD